MQLLIKRDRERERERERERGVKMQLLNIRREREVFVETSEELCDMCL